MFLRRESCGQTIHFLPVINNRWLAGEFELNIYLRLQLCAQTKCHPAEKLGFKKINESKLNQILLPNVIMINQIHKRFSFKAISSFSLTKVPISISFSFNNSYFYESKL